MSVRVEPVELPEGVLAVRSGPGANCSSIGSLVDLLFGTAVVAGGVYLAVIASLGDRRVEQVGEPPPSKPGRGDPSAEGGEPPVEEDEG